jgi:hypothetical protein
MRNPLNSIINHCRIEQIVCHQMDSLLQIYRQNNSIDETVYKNLIHMQQQIAKGNSIQTSSSNMLLLNVEDILGFAQLKANKFVKIYKRFSIKRAIEDIQSIQLYQAASKRITLTVELYGFPTKDGKFATDIPLAQQNHFIISDE